jgi:signal transduction histidine kinase
MNLSEIKMSKRPSGLNWSKVHLVYFALAAFDLIAIMLGLWLSHYTGNKFQESMASVQGVQFIKVHAAHMQELASELSRPTNDIFAERNPDKALADLKAARDNFEAYVSEKNFMAMIEKLTGKSFGEGQGPKVSQVKIISQALNIDAFVVEAFEEKEDEIRDQAAEIFAFSEQSIAAFRSGDITAAALKMQHSDQVSRGLTQSINALALAADKDLRKIIEDSQRSFAFAKMMQYIIGAGILLMVGMVLAYGHFVGKLLRQKFQELQKAQVAFDQFNLQLHAMNDDISKLNIDLKNKMTSLKEAQDEIVRKGRMEQLGQLTATIAHELRNPLGAVRTTSYLLERKLKDKGLGLEVQLDRINKGVSRCDNIITQLLDFSRAKAVQRNGVVLDDWVAKILEEEVTRLPEDLTLECHLGVGDAVVSFDQERMRRVLVNLLSNAAEALTDSKEVAVAKKKKIIIKTAIAGGVATIVVQDNGPGMSDEVRAKILEPLFTTKSFGTGLGLPAVDNILTNHGGGLKIESRPGEGAAFTAWWPLECGAATNSEAA